MRAPLREVFAFFAAARNLEPLTPPWLRFEVLTPDPVAMRVGVECHRLGLLSIGRQRRIQGRQGGEECVVAVVGLAIRRSVLAGLLRAGNRE